MDRLDLVRRMIEEGSDALVARLHDRLCADRLVRASAGRVPADRCDVPSWDDLAGHAVAERVLAPEEAESLLLGLTTSLLPPLDDAGSTGRPACRRERPGWERQGA